MNISRRKFLVFGLSFLAGAPFIGKYISKAESQEGKVKIDISGMEIGQVRSAAWGEKTVYVRLYKDKLTVLVGNCPHQGCVVSVEGEGWLCPCHRAKFDKEGNRLSGPATDLITPPYKLIKDIVEIG